MALSSDVNPNALKQVDIEKFSIYYAPAPAKGQTLPQPNTVREYTFFFLQTSVSTFVKHIMIGGAWYKETLDADDNIILTRV